MDPGFHLVVDQTYERLLREAREGGYILNPDVEFTKSLIQGLLKNQDRYGYWSCPCRLASGNKLNDLDIICPCDYRDPDLTEFGACYCALYISPEVAKGSKALGSIPERRPVNGPGKEESEAHDDEYEPVMLKGLPFPVWRCKVCGYLCARPAPPDICPICKVTKERFEKFM